MNGEPDPVPPDNSDIVSELKRPRTHLLPVEHDPFSETPPVPGAMKAADGCWYIHDPLPSRKGKFMRWTGGKDGH